MWIETITNSKGTRYKYIERYQTHTGEQRKVSVTLNSNTPHAKKQATKLLHEKIEKALADAEQEEKQKHLFHTIARDWQALKDMTTKFTTNRTRAGYLNKALSQIEPNTYIEDITPIEIEEICTRLYHQEGYSYRYTKGVLFTIKAVFKYARKKRIINDIIDIQDIELKQKPITLKEIKAKENKLLSQRELRILYEGVKVHNERVALLVEFMALTGLRIGECLALREQDYNRFTKSINVNGTLTQVGSLLDRNTRTSPKNCYSIRDVALCDRSLAILNRVISENKKSTLYSTEYKPSGYIWTTSKGKPYDMHFINRVLKRVPVNGRTITSHALRHTHISMLAELGVPLKAIMQRVGHNEPNTTLKIYTHVAQESQSEIAEKLNQIV